MGAYILAETVGAKLLVEDGKVVGVRTGDKGRDKSGGEKGNFEPGSDVMAKATVLAEGCWGHLTGAALKALGPRAQGPAGVGAGRQGGVGGREAVREDRPHARLAAARGRKWKEFGGSWIYGMNREGETPKVSIGFVTGLDYTDARFSVHDVLQEFKLHPLVKKILEGGKRVAWGAKAIPEGGYWAMPTLHAPGMVIAGDAGGMVNVPKLKGIHYAIESGRLAAETIYEQLKARLERLLGLREGHLRLRDGQGALRVAQHEAAVRQGPDPRRRDHQRDGGHQGPLPGRALGHAPRRRGAADARHRPREALSQARRQVHVRQAQRRLPDRQRDPRRRAARTSASSSACRARSARAGPGCAPRASTRSPRTRRRRG